MVCHGGGDSGGVSYVQSPEARAMFRKMLPTFNYIYGHGKPQTDLYSIPKLNIKMPKMQDADISQYMAGGETFQNAYDQIAPSLWNTYERNVENPLINRFAGSGSLGSGSGGVSGAAMDVLSSKRGDAGSAINAQAFQLAQQPLLAAFGAESQGNLAEYGANANAAMQRAMMPWQETIKMRQYPYQILPGMMGGTMSQPVVTQGGGK